jgi:uncharacterized protein (TIGR02099 family)
MAHWVRKVVKHTLIVKAIGVGVVALAIGGSHLLLRQLPEHQAEVKDWVRTELGLTLDFSSLDAGWSWRGPELAFHDARVTAAGDTTPFLTARSASVGFNPVSLVRELLTRSAIGADRLTFEGTELTLVKTADGGYRLQGAPADRQSVRVPPDIDVLVRDSRVLYLDAARNVAWDFHDVEASMRRDGDMLALAASATPPNELAARIEVTAQAFIADDNAPGAQFTGDWRLTADLAQVNLAAAGRLLPASVATPMGGSGDVSVWLEWQNRELVGGTTRLALADVVLPGRDGAADSRFDRIAATGDWQRRDATLHVALRDLAVVLGGRAWPAGATIDVDLTNGSAGIERLALQSAFMRLEDLEPFLALAPPSRLIDSWFELAPRGDLRNLDLQLVHDSADELDYTIATEFADFGIAPFEGAPGFESLSGEVRADSRAGRLELMSSGAVLDWPTVFRGRLDVPELRGIVVWRAGQDAVRLVSDDLLVVTPDASLRANLELTLPMDGSSPVLDLRSDVSAFDIAAVQRYLPANKMPPTVVDWLDAALRGGRVSQAELSFTGPVAKFPFDGGEGEFRANAVVEGGTLKFIADWPYAEDLSGAVEFVNASFVANGSGRVLGNRSENLHVGIPDLRQGELALTADAQGPLADVLAFLNGAPLISRYLGSEFVRLEALSGTGNLGLDLLLPLRNREAYQLAASLDIVDGELMYRGFDPHATEINGSLTLASGELRGEGIQAIFLDGPVAVGVAPAGVPGYRVRLDLDGEVTIDAVAQAFKLPYPQLLAGQTSWQGSLLIPAAQGESSLPARLTVDSNLSGVALRFPEPFAKAPGEPVNLDIEMSFPEGLLAMNGYLGATRRFALEFDADAANDGKYTFRRAALQFGGALPEFRAERGVTLDGSLPRLRVDDWLALPDGADYVDTATAEQRTDWGNAFAGADLAVADFALFGQRLGSTKVTARRRTDDWQLELDSDAIAGTLLIPVDLANDPQVVAVMRRLYLSAGDGEPSTGRELDPRELPGVQLHADEFGIGQRQLGRLDAEILSDPLGLRLVSFESATDSFTAQGSGGWFVGSEGATTRFAVSIASTNVRSMLDQLGFAPFVEAESAEVTASVYWPGGPSGAWLDHASGDLALRAGKGSLIDVAPGGAGRAVGLLSISALPRRLALDFRDVFNRGFVFDEITADFVVVDGDAYTDNLKLTGPVADVGIVGRTGLRDRDYRQQVVVTAEPGKMLPTVGALIGGPPVAAALLIFTRIFKKPLSGIGRASYCLTGSWSEPSVERLTAEQLEQGSLCAELPPNGALSKPPEVAAR